jgi:transcriptional regulator with XRE-family HTH domain
LEPIPAPSERPPRGTRVRAQEVDQHVAMRLRERRLLLGLTQQQVAAPLGIAVQQLHKYETGVNRVTVGRLYQLAEVLEVGVGYFFAGLGPEAAGVAAPPVPAERQRALLALARDFARLPDQGHREALCLLARALAETRAG